ncbi:MAG TPA: POTRA domain-containing protein, partial [Holophaga sp.]|nr:POTRA domain-containing protein [Holophaga sp.]
MQRSGLPAAMGLLLALPSAHAQAPARTLGTVEFRGGSPDDQSYASAALGLAVGKPLGEDAFLQALAAVRATDRFRRVSGALEEGPKGLVARVELDPWPAIEAREIHGDLPKDLLKNLFTGMHKGARAGDLRIARWQEEAGQRLEEAGYLGAKVRIEREDQGARLVIVIDTGKPAKVQSLDVEGDPAPYKPEEIKGFIPVKPGKTLWTANLQREAEAELRRRLVKDHRLEGTTDFLWDETTGKLRVKVDPGPVVKIRQEGEWSFWWKNLADLVPLSRAGRYSPDLLEEGDRRILRYLRDQGYLEAQVGHSRDVLKGTVERPQEVAVTFTVHPGDQIHISDIRFERNKEISEAELKKAVELPSGLWTMGAPPTTPALIGDLESRIKALYWSRGYPDVALRRPPMEHVDGKTILVFQVREGAYQGLDKVVLEVPADPGWQPWELAECLPLIFTSRLITEARPDASTRVYRSDRPATDGVMGSVQQTEDPARPEVSLFTLTFNKPLPFVKGDLALMYSTLRERLSALGLQRPLPKLQLDPSERGYVVHILVQDQPRLEINRLVVQGSDTTKAEAVFRETELDPGAPLDASRLAKAQTNL